MELIAEHGFKTANEPLLGTQPEMLAHRGLNNITEVSTIVPNPLASQSIGYIKGLGRTSTMAAFLLHCKQHMIDLKEKHPLLHKSLLVIHVWRYLCDNKMEETLKNMNMSAASAIRKAPNVIAIVSMSSKLMAEGMEDYGEFIRRYNQSAPRQYKIQGQKAQTLKVLLGTMRGTKFMEVLAYYIYYYYYIMAGPQLLSWLSSCEHQAAHTHKLHRHTLHRHIVNMLHTCMLNTSHQTLCPQIHTVPSDTVHRLSQKTGPQSRGPSHFQTKLSKGSSVNDSPHWPKRGWKPALAP